MEITEVKVFSVGDDKLKAFVSVVFDSCFMVNDIKVIQGRESLFISMPSRRKKNGQFKDVAHPLNNDTRKMIEDRVLSEYLLATGQEGAPIRIPEARTTAESPATEEKSLEEVAEMHLSDSFWTS